MKTLILEYDDFHWKSPENCLDFLHLIIEKYKNIKISLFTTPIHSGLKLSDNMKWCSSVKKLIDSGNICLSVHGTFHSFEEFKNVSFEDACDLIKLSEQEFESAKLNYLKVFRGPNWGINQNTYDALIKMKYTHIYTHENYKELADKNKNIKNVIYNWNLKDDVDYKNDVLIAHGHTFDVCSNSIEKTFFKVEEFINNNDFIYKMVNEI